MPELAPVTLTKFTILAGIDPVTREISASVNKTTNDVIAEVSLGVGQKGEQGDQGGVGPAGHSPVLTWSGDQIAVDGVVSGPHLTGPQGLQGPQGVQGAPGADGAAGSTGAPGADGHSPVLTWSGDQIAVDGIVSGPHLTGPQGAQGVQGIQGPQGAQGLAGADGADGSDGAPGADGHSPVLTWSGDQIAVDGIATGPHLTGPQGLQGAQGVQGIQGPQGTQGLAGADGADGSPGADGHSPVLTWSGDQIAVDGVVSGPHLTGPQGLQGPQGDQGVAGADGSDAAQLVYIQQERPAEPGPWAWWVTDAGGNIVNLIINNGV